MKILNEKEIAMFSKPFSANPTPVLVRNNEIASIITPSEDFRRKVIQVDCVSGASLMKYQIERGLIVHRKDAKDAKKGFPINVDLYSLEGSILSKVNLPFEGHWLTSLPTFN